MEPFPPPQISWRISSRTPVSPAGGEIAISIALLFLLCLVPTLAHAQSMKLLSAHTGWVSTQKRLYWTTDGGDHWSNVTPLLPDRPHFDQKVKGVFFRDTSEGWAVVSYAEPIPSTKPKALWDTETAYSIAHTQDSGTTWSAVPLSYPELPEWIQDTFAGPGGPYFVDSQHGWLDMLFAGNAKPGKLLATEDGGKTWNWVNSPGLFGRITFSSLQDGWLLGYENLYVTHDGCKTWQKVNLSPPPRIRADIFPNFQSPPVFLDQQNGYLLVHYGVTPEAPGKLVMYSTKDGGRNWQPIKTLPEAHVTSSMANFPFAVVDSDLVISSGLRSSDLGITLIPLRSSSSSAKASYRAVLAMTFADTANGWVLTPGRQLLATNDGGSTWTDISPEHAPSFGIRTPPAQNGPKPNAVH
jgi:photosystem II stability/assembly factor-like uncharacterized protein